MNVRRLVFQFRPFVIVLAAGLLLAAKGAGAQPSCAVASPSDGLRLAVAPRPDNALIADAAVELADAAPIYLEYGNGEVGWLRTSTIAAGTALQVPIVRLRAETAYQVRAFALDPTGCPVAVATAELTTGRLPDQLRNYVADQSGVPSFPLVMMDWPSIGPFVPPTANVDKSRYLTAVDQQGHVVWYYLTPPEYPVPAAETSAYPIIQRANGNLLYIAAYHSLDELTPDGRIVWRFRSESGPASRPHHEVVEQADGRLLYLGAETRLIDDSRNGGLPGVPVVGDTLHVIDYQTGAEAEVWNAFATLDATQRPQQWNGWKIREDLDWTHANAMNIGARGNVIISLRHLDQIISLSPDFKTIEWKLGGPDSSFSFPNPADRFWGQHSVVELPNGRILLFDNGNYRPDGEFSRVLELELDFVTMSARKVWEYAPTPEIFSDKVSNVVRLPNGNTVVNFGWRVAPDEPALVQEVRPDGTVAWEQSMRWRGMRAARYRAYPFTSLGGEVPVEPTAFQP